MRGKRRVEITVERDDLLIIRQRRSPGPTWCPSCGDHAPMVTPEVAAAMVQVTPRAVYRSVEADQIHYTETPEGQVLICLKSLEQQISMPDRVRESEQ